MNSLHKLEEKLASVFRGAPKLSANSKTTIVGVWPWVALAFGVLQLAAAWALWRLAHAATALDHLANNISLYYTGHDTGLSSLDKGMIYLGILVLVVDAVVLLMAYPGLKARTKSGWELLFLSALINLVYALVQVFISGRGLGSFVLSVLESAIIFYFLFQIRDQYGRKAVHTGK